MGKDLFLTKIDLLRVKECISFFPEPCKRSDRCKVAKGCKRSDRFTYLLTN